MENTELLDQIKVVAKTRGEAKVLSDKRKAMYDAFISQHTEFFADVVAAATVVSEAETILRDLTIEAFNTTGNKQPAPGVAIRETKVYTYNSKEAFKWAIEHKLALALDTKAFEGYAKQEDFDFVSTSVKVIATIAKELEVTPTE